MKMFMRSALHSRFYFSTIIIFLSLFLGIWLFTTRSEWTNTPSPHLLKGIGTFTGIVGYTLLSLSFLLASRWQKLEKKLGGLDKIYHLHHHLGLWGFIFIIFHPLIIALKWLPHRLDKFYLFLFPFHGRLSMNLGSIAFWMMVIIVGMTLFKCLAYDKWKITHQFMTLVFLFASLHIILSERRFSSSALSQSLLYIPMGIGFFGILYKQVIVAWLMKHPLFEVTERKFINDNVVEITLTPTEKPLSYAPGQYVFFQFKGPHLTKESHPFTLMEFPNDPSKISILAKTRGDFTRSLYQHIQPGYLASLEGPYGNFDYRQAGKSQIWIGGGIGIVPFIAWARSLHGSTFHNRKIDLFYCFHRKSDGIFVEEFRHANFLSPHFRYFLFCSEEKNRLSAQKVKTLANGLEDKDILMCGPKRLTSALLKEFQSLGVKRKNILFEDFEFF